MCLSVCEPVFACKSICFSGFYASVPFRDKHFKLLKPQCFALPAHCVNTANESISLPPLSSTSHVCHSEEAQCGFKGRTSMSCFTLFTINPNVLPSVFTVQWRKSSGKGNIKQSEQYNAEQTLLTHLGISSTKWQTCHFAAVRFQSLFLTLTFYFELWFEFKCVYVSLSQNRIKIFLHDTPKFVVYFNWSSH